MTIVAGCGVHADGEEDARHNGVHRFVLAKGAHVLYLEKHLGTGTGTGARKIDPVTEVEQAEDSVDGDGDHADRRRGFDQPHHVRHVWPRAPRCACASAC